MESRRVGIILLVFTGIGALVGTVIGILIGEFFPEFTIGLFGAGTVTALNPLKLSIGMGLANGSGFGCAGGIVASLIEAFAYGKRQRNSPPLNALQNPQLKTLKSDHDNRTKHQSACHEEDGSGE